MLAQRSGRVKAAGGFTLTELVMVMVVIAIIAAIALPRMSNDPLVVAAQAEQLAADIRYVQTLAMTQGQRYLISFPSNTSYEFRNSSGAVVRHPLDGSLAIVLGGGVTLALAPPAPGAGNAIGFNGLGVPYSVTAPSAFNGPLTAQATLTLTKDGANQQITVAPETGKVTP
jgi:prepilin-type N-terminal cleavage/methylation domain-containing protein